jgi:hypothetical protein
LSEPNCPVPYDLGGGEVVARFIYSRRNLSNSTLRPKPTAFDPSPYHELSVAHSTGLTDEQIWEIGSRTLGTQPGRTTIHGRADVTVRALIEQQLRALRDDDRFARHTSVVGWPSSADPDQDKQRRKQICLELSQHPDVILAVPVIPITTGISGTTRAI